MSFFFPEPPDPPNEKLIVGEAMFCEMLSIIESAVMDVRTTLDDLGDEWGERQEAAEDEIVRICRESAHDAVRAFLILKDEL